MPLRLFHDFILALSCFLVRGPSILMHIYIPVTSKKQVTSFAIFVYPGKIVRVRKRESIIGVQWGQGNPNLRVHRSSGKRGFAEFPTGTVDPRVGISRFHCTPMIDSISHISNKE